jgi:hypothetical protein
MIDSAFQTLTFKEVLGEGFGEERRMNRSAGGASHSSFLNLSCFCALKFFLVTTGKLKAHCYLSGPPSSSRNGKVWLGVVRLPFGVTIRAPALG